MGLDVLIFDILKIYRCSFVGSIHKIIVLSPITNECRIIFSVKAKSRNLDMLSV